MVKWKVKTPYGFRKDVKGKALTWKTKKSARLWINQGNAPRSAKIVKSK